MLFTSTSFLFFFLLTLFFYYLFSKKFRAQNLVLLLASLLFYFSWDPRFLFLLFLSTMLNFSCAQFIQNGQFPSRQRLFFSLSIPLAAVFFVILRWQALYPFFLTPDISPFSSLTISPGSAWWVLGGSVAIVLLANLGYPLLHAREESYRRKATLAISVIGNLILLGFFKYFNFFTDSLQQLLNLIFGTTTSATTFQIIMPVGISFFTFQGIGYTVDVYRRKINATNNFIDFATFIAFFPKLIQGPIEQAKNFLPQLQKPRPPISREVLREAMWLIAWGCFKKMVVADNVAAIVASTFGPFDNLTAPAQVPADGLRLLVGIYAYTVQIYADFSGYTDIARGISKLMGFELMQNFNLPYFATSPSEFWRRWHISLSTWLRDYIYIPLGGNRKGVIKEYRNLFCTFLLGGLWHGAAWTFVLWGAFHGALLCLYRFFGVRTEKHRQCLAISIPQGFFMFHLTCLGWLLFRAQNLETISVFLHGIFLHPHASAEAWELFRNLAYFSWFLVFFQIMQAFSKDLDPMKNWHWFLRFNVWIFIVMSLLVDSSRGQQEFLYFAF